MTQVESGNAMLRCLKGMQLAVAVATMLALGAGLLWPGAMGFFIMPFGLLYVIWAIRAAFDKRFSIWLAFTSSLVVAVFLGTFVVAMAFSTFKAGYISGGELPLVTTDPTGNVVQVQLSPEAFSKLQQVQAQVNRRDQIHALLLLLIDLGAWIVIVLYAFQWRWAFARNTSK